MRTRALTSAIVGVSLLVLASCGDADVESASASDQVAVSDEHAEAAGLTWVNQTGLDRTDAAVWADRLSRACSGGLDSVEGLAEEFIAADLEVSVRSEELGAVSVLAARQAISISMRPVCPDLFDE